MARVLTRCPTDGRAVPTGQRMTEAQLQAAGVRYAFRCAACGQVHTWDRQDAWVEAVAR